MQKILTRLAIGWLVFVPLMTALNVLTYSGLYRWLCEWQLASGGEYEAVMTAVVPAVLLIAPAFAFLRTRYPDAAKVAVALQDRPAAERRGRRILATIGLSAAAVCCGALLWAWHLPDREGPSVLVDLATLQNAAPPLGRVTLVGTIDADHVARKSTSGKASGGARHIYAPVLPRGSFDRPSPIFVDEYVGREIDQPLPTEGGNRFRGVLIEGGLPGDMLRQFERIGVRVTDPYYVLRTGPDGDRTNAYVTAMLSGFAAMLTLIPLAGLLVAGTKTRR